MKILEMRRQEMKMELFRFSKNDIKARILYKLEIQSYYLGQKT